ncbi:hypothetical protein BOX15_Mlig005012g5, partial [Macrostomum lignano]
ASNLFRALSIMRSWIDDIYTTIDNNISWISKVPAGLGVIGLLTLARRRYWLVRWRSLASLPAEVRSGQWAFRVRVQRCDCSTDPVPVELVAKHEPVLFTLPILLRNRKQDSSSDLLKLRLAGLNKLTPEGLNWLQNRLTNRIVRVRVLQLVSNDTVGLCAIFQWRLMSWHPLSYRCIAEQLVASGLAQRCHLDAEYSEIENSNSQHWKALLDRLEVAENEAKRRRLGLWRPPANSNRASFLSSLIGRLKAWWSRRNRDG